MIKSREVGVYNAINGDSDYIYAHSHLNLVDDKFIVITYYQRFVNNEYINIFVMDEIYSFEEVDAIFDLLKDTIGNLPFHEMLQTGIELALLQDLNSNDKFGIPAYSDGWVIMQ